MSKLDKGVILFSQFGGKNLLIFASQSLLLFLKHSFTYQTNLFEGEERWILWHSSSWFVSKIVHTWASSNRRWWVESWRRSGAAAVVVVILVQSKLQLLQATQLSNLVAQTDLHFSRAESWRYWRREWRAILRWGNRRWGTCRGGRPNSKQTSNSQTTPFCSWTTRWWKKGQSRDVFSKWRRTWWLNQRKSNSPVAATLSFLDVDTDCNFWLMDTLF